MSHIISTSFPQRGSQPYSGPTWTREDTDFLVFQMVALFFLGSQGPLGTPLFVSLLVRKGQRQHAEKDPTF